MSDQYKSSYRQNENVSGVDYRPDIPPGTIEMINRKFAEWEKRRGFASSSMFKQTRGIALRHAKQKAAASTAHAKTAAKKSRKSAKSS